MKRWRKTINIKPIIYRDQGNTDPDYVAAIGKEIASLLRSHLTEPELVLGPLEAIEVLEDIDQDDFAVFSFNRALSDLYDWADRERVWLGI